MKKTYKHLLLSSAILTFGLLSTANPTIISNKAGITAFAETKDEWKLEDDKGTYTLKEDTKLRPEPRLTDDKVEVIKVGQKVDYDKTTEFDGYKWISFINESDERMYLATEKLETETKKNQVSSESSKNEENTPSVEVVESSSAESSQDKKKETKVLSEEEDALTSTYDVPEKKSTSYATESWTRIPSIGTYYFQGRHEIKEAPTKSSRIITYFDKGWSVNYDSKVYNDGFEWLSYVSTSGQRRYVKMGEDKSGNQNPNSKVVPPFNINNAGLINYVAHVQNVGWQNWSKDGDMSGTSGRGLRMEAFQLQLGKLPYSGSVEYRAHVQNIGWQNWFLAGQTAGTSGRGLRMEALEIRLTGDLAKYYDVEYRAHVQNVGWQKWSKNGQTAGTSGRGLRMEALEIRLVKKNNAGSPWEIKPETGVYKFTKKSDIKSEPRKSAQSVGYYDEGATVAYDGKVNFDGGVWITYVAGSGIRRYIQIDEDKTTDPTPNPAKGDINYKSHVQNVGWQGWVKDGELSGTKDRGLRMEAFELELGKLPYSGSVEYRAHVQNIGWQSWVGPGQIAGTIGRGLRMEALEIRLTGELAKHYDIQYRGHVQNVGWQKWVENGQMAGTSGRGLRMEALEISLIEK